MLTLRCSICGKTMEVVKCDDLPSFPFCSGRCKAIDLGRWLDERYPVPTSPDPDELDALEMTE